MWNIFNKIYRPYRKQNKKIIRENDKVCKYCGGKGYLTGKNVICACPYCDNVAFFVV